MKRSKRPAKSKTGRKASPAHSPVPETGISRRDILGRAKKVGIIAGVAALGGFAVVRTVRADMHEHDLDRVGKGVPTVVQVHDPHCPTCRALQRQVRKAMAAFDGDELQYAIASLEKPEGRRLALDHGVGKITLLLFDGQGRRQDILTGMATAAALEQRFRQHIR